MASNRNFRDTTQSPDVQDEGDSGGGGVSPRLLEQLNSARLDQISNSMKIISEKSVTQNLNQLYKEEAWAMVFRVSLSGLDCCYPSS